MIVFFQGLWVSSALHIDDNLPDDSSSEEEEETEEATWSFDRFDNIKLELWSFKLLSKCL
jgi:hypothetical protein